MNRLTSNVWAIAPLVAAVFLLAGVSQAQSKKASTKAVGSEKTEDARGKEKPEKTAFDFVLPGADGKDVPLTNFKGKFVLLVNLARKSSYAAQLPALMKLSQTYKDKNLLVIGIPCNDFGAAEPGTEVEIQKAYADANVTFPVMAVAKLSGDAAIPLYVYLTKSKGAPPGGPLAWNYTKFFLDKDGKVVARLSPDVAPDSVEMLATVEQILGGRYKPAKKDDKGADGEDPDDDGD